MTPAYVIDQSQCQVAHFCIYQVWPPTPAPWQLPHSTQGDFLVEEVKIGLSECIHRAFERKNTRCTGSKGSDVISGCMCGFGAIRLDRLLHLLVCPRCRSVPPHEQRSYSRVHTTPGSNVDMPIAGMYDEGEEQSGSDWTPARYGRIPTQSQRKIQA